jgi:hypothetical protein
LTPPACAATPPALPAASPSSPNETARAIAVERYSWPVIAGRLVEIYERVTRVEGGLRAA